VNGVFVIDGELQREDAKAQRKPKWKSLASLRLCVRALTDEHTREWKVDHE
jgi:hypothetical protein